MCVCVRCQCCVVGVVLTLFVVVLSVLFGVDEGGLVVVVVVVVGGVVVVVVVALITASGT